jgi:hypothetical protein
VLKNGPVIDGPRDEQTVAVFSKSESVSGPGVEMFVSLFSTCAVGLVFIVIVLTIVIPFILGIFDRRELP